MSGFPFLSVNFALSADGKISSAARRPSGWTSAQDHQRLKQLRDGADALLVGNGTLKADRMTMKAPGNPWRCVVSRSGNFDPEARLFHTPGGPIHLLATEGTPAEIPGTVAHRGSLEDFLIELSAAGIGRVHCEGGGSLVKALAELDAVEQIHLTWAGHTLFGGGSAPTILGTPGDFLPASLAYELKDFQPLPETGECFLTYRRVRPLP